MCSRSAVLLWFVGSAAFAALDLQVGRAQAEPKAEAAPEVTSAGPSAERGASGCEGLECTGEGSPSVEGSRKNWVSLAIQQDLLFLSSSTNSCSVGTAYECFREDGTFYGSVPYSKAGGEIAGGPSAATLRVTLGYARSFYNFTAGVRLGFAFGGGPRAPSGKGFFPMHAEVHLAYWFGSAPFARLGLRPYVTLGGGAAEVDSNEGVSIYETEADFKANRSVILNAWRKTGLGFVGGGAGLLYAISPRMGPYAEIRVMQMFGASGTGMGLQLGYSLGL